MFQMQSDIVPYLLATAKATLGDMPPMQWHDGYSLCVVMANPGYPGTPQNGTPIPNLDGAWGDHAYVFQAGTKAEGDNIVAHGGRVLGVTARGHDIAEAQARAYAVVERLRWPGCQVRRDIGHREASRRR
jgi:phosphoribosylamine--glycine ligase